MEKMPEKPDKNEQLFSTAVDIREKRKLRAEKERRDQFWFGLGMFGLVGWSVSVPTVMGIFIGLWIDMKNPGQYSWTLMLLLVGLVLGCINAWIWITRERSSIHRERDNNGD